MKIGDIYSHLNGEEYLKVHHHNLFKEIKDVIGLINANKCRTKRSEEKGREGELLYSPEAINAEFVRIFKKRKGWEPSVRRQFYVPLKRPIQAQTKLLQTLNGMSFDEQREYLDKEKIQKVNSFNQTDFVKNRVAVEVQLGKYFAITYDLFVKHLSFYHAGIIDIGVEILPMKSLQEHMSSGPPFFEKEVHNILQHGRNVPPVPLLVIGIEP